MVLKQLGICLDKNELHFLSHNMNKCLFKMDHESLSVQLSSVQFSCSVVYDSLLLSSSVVPFFSCPQSFPASGSFPVSQLFTSGGQRIQVSASASVLPMKTQDWSPLGCTVWISLQSKGLSRVFSNNTVQKHQFFSAQLSSVQLLHPYMTTEKP